jgi:predicted Zn-ribbon and HTH transcriptional regulator
MNDFTKEELTIHAALCQKCGYKMNDTAAVFWNKEMTKIIEWRASCSNRCCDYVLVSKND